MFDFNPFSFEDFSDGITPLELYDYDLPSKLVDLSKVQAFVDVAVDQSSCLGFIIFQSTCPTITFGQTSYSSLDVTTS